MLRRLLPATFAGALGLPMLACSGGDRPAYARSADVDRGVTIVDPPAAPYAPIAVQNGGSLDGAVHFAGEAPEDTTIAITRDERVCGNTLRTVTVQTSDNRVAGAVVWLADVRRGRPLPLSKRFELVQNRCTFGPFVQVAVAGGALNVRSDDAVSTRTVVVDTRTLDTLAVLPFNSPGALVPLDAQLRRPAMLEIRSTTHPWMEAWVAVLDHPYFATTDRDGSFTIEGIPAGTYQVKAWHPRFGLTTGNVVVQPGSTATLDLEFGAGSGSEAAAVAQR
ncbi:MAG TPA: carboxypeptidase regulatory-like domain-containing protein [Gemmatimonadaceae bacterium]|nr:carboxypeptidase regulatory-like domain-containing protein [Gemmatimonadaceae bacterium]